MSKKISFHHALCLFPLLLLAFGSCTGSKKAKIATSVSTSTPVANNTATPSSDEVLILLSTDSGDIKIRLYNETPQHRDNFIKLVKEGFYDSLLFHRVIRNFMIQGGDPDSKRADDGKMLGEGDVKYTIPAEFNPKLFHKKGALCAARQGDEVNPQKASSGCQFYLVQGRKLSDNDITQFEYRINRPLLSQLSNELNKNPENQKLRQEAMRFRQEAKQDSLNMVAKKLDELLMIEYKKTPHYEFSEEQKNAYRTIGGTPHLDGSYTVFGEVYEGLEVIDKIASVATGQNDRPQKNVRIKKARIIEPKKEKQSKKNSK